MQPALNSTALARRPALAWVVLLGLISLASYAAVNFVVPLAPRYMEAPAARIGSRWAFWRALMAQSPPGDADVVVIALAAALLPLAAWLAALWLAWHVPATRPLLAVVSGFALLFFLTSVLSLPHNSHDLYGYISYARVAGIYGANPYVVPPIDFAPDPFLAYNPLPWIQSTVPYGPVWVFFSALVVRLGGDSQAGTVLLMRSALLACNLANVALIAFVLNRHNPRHVLPAVLFYAWNPVVVLKGQDHNEPLMVFFLLLAVALYYAGRRWLGLAALSLSALAKFVTAPLVPLYLLRLWRSAPLGRVAVGILLALALAALAFLPFGQFGLVAERLWRVVAPVPGQLPPARVLAAGAAVLAALAWAAWHELRGPRLAPPDDLNRGLLAGWAVVLYALLLLYPSSTYAWFTITIAALVGLVRQPVLVILAAALVASFHLNNLLVHIVNDFAPLPLGIEGTARLVRWGIPLAVWAGLLVRWRPWLGSRLRDAA
jgi:hypothetical protein